MVLVLDRAIDASPEEIFAVLMDVGLGVQWMPAIREIHDMTPGPFRVGTSWQEVRLVGSRVRTGRIRVTEFDAGKVLEIRLASRSMTGQMRYTLLPTTGGTHVHYEAVVEGRGVTRVATRRMNKKMEEGDRDLLDRLAMQIAQRRAEAEV